MRIVLIMAAMLPALAGIRTAVACTVFFVSDGKTVLAGNNEDFDDPRVYMWVYPPEEGKHGRIIFGYRDMPMQGGVNDQGLFFDGLALSTIKPAANKNPRFKGNILEAAMAECSTVKGVVAFFEKYDRRFLSSAQLMYGDRSGQSVIIEADTVIWKKKSHQVATNFRHSKVMPSQIKCKRYRSASRILGKVARPDVELCRQALQAACQKGPGAHTIYSNVYDLTNNVIHLYFFHDFGNAVTIRLDEVFKKGRHACKIASLFPKNKAYLAFSKQQEEGLARRLAKLKTIKLTSAELDSYVGRYDLPPGSELAVEKDMGQLVLARGNRRIRFLPQAKDRFIHVSLSTFVNAMTLSFQRDSEGKVTGMEVSVMGRKVSGKKINSPPSPE